MCGDFCNSAAAANMTLTMHGREQVTKAVEAFCCFSKLIYCVVAFLKVEIVDF